MSGKADLIGTAIRMRMRGLRHCTGCDRAGAGAPDDSRAGYGADRVRVPGLAGIAITAADGQPVLHSAPAAR